MPRKRPLTRRTALGLIGVGGVMTVAETFGFDEILAGRSVAVNTSADPDAVLGLEGIDDSSVTPTFTNQSSYEMDVTLDSVENIEFDVGDDGDWRAPPVTFALSTGASEEVNVRFTGECADSGSATVDIDVELTNDADESVGSIALTREFEIPEAGQMQFTGEASSSGKNGKYHFDIENTGCEDVTFTGVGINETTTDANVVSGGGSLFNDDTGEMLVQNEIPIDSSNPDEDTRLDMDPSLTLPRDATVTLRFEKFQSASTNGNSGLDMRDEDVRVTLYLSDGSSATIKLCIGSCDF